MSVKFYNYSGIHHHHYPCLKLEIGSIWDGSRLGSFAKLTIYKLTLGLGLDLERT